MVATPDYFFVIDSEAEKQRESRKLMHSPLDRA